MAIKQNGQFINLRYELTRGRLEAEKLNFFRPKVEFCQLVTEQIDEIIPLYLLFFVFTKVWNESEREDENYLSLMKKDWSKQTMSSSSSMPMFYCVSFFFSSEQSVPFFHFQGCFVANSLSYLKVMRYQFLWLLDPKKQYIIFVLGLDSHNFDVKCFGLGLVEAEGNLG